MEDCFSSLYEMPTTAAASWFLNIVKYFSSLVAGKLMEENAVTFNVADRS